MSAWFRFGALHHYELVAGPQRAGGGSRPTDPQPTFESEDPPDFACRACLLAWLESQVGEEPLEVAVERGYDGFEV